MSDIAGGEFAHVATAVASCFLVQVLHEAQFTYSPLRHLPKRQHISKTNNNLIVPIRLNLTKPGHNNNNNNRQK